MTGDFSAFETTSHSIVLPGYRWITFTVHRATRQLECSSARDVLNTLSQDPAFVREYRTFGVEPEITHGPYILGKILSSDWLELPLPLEVHPVLNVVMHGSGVYEDCAPEPDKYTITRIAKDLADIPSSYSYFFLQLDPTKNEDRLSELGYILCEYSQHLFVSQSLDQVHCVTVGCD
jgi:hypothetical protein